ncbi:MAG: ABC transporter permease [Chloroflexi bacterium]|nr:ABC transporter permease [Chloroflexota bacterium]
MKRLLVPASWRFTAAIVLGIVLFASGLVSERWFDLDGYVKTVIEGMFDVEIPDGFTVPRSFGQQAAQTEVTDEQANRLSAATDLPPAVLRQLQFTFIAIFNPISLYGGYAVSAAGALIALGGAIGLGRKRSASTWDWMIRCGGLVSGVFFTYWLGTVNSAATVVPIVPSMNVLFWVALAATALMILRELLPSPPVEQLDQVASVSVGQNIGVAFDALRANKLRSALTMLGIVIGVMAVVSLLSVGRGAEAVITDQINNIGTNLVTVLPTTGISTLTLEDADAIRASVNDLASVVPQYIASAQIKSDQGSVQARVVGTSVDYTETSNLTVDLGRFFDATEYQTAARVAIVGTAVAEELFGGLSPVGRTIRVNSQRLEIIGLMQERDAGFGANPNLQIYVPLTTSYRSLFNARGIASSLETVSSIIISVESPDDIPRAKDDISRLLRRRHELALDDEDDFLIFDQQQLLDAASTITGVLTVMLGAIAGVSLLVGGIGIMNISLVSVTERTREIGLRKALGARRSHILQQFLIETTVLSTIGGALGVLLGVGLAQLINASGVLTASITADSVLLGLGFSIMVGIFFGVYPARRAARLQPIEALRYE